MAITIAEMVDKGLKKMRRKIPTMKANYDAAKGRAKDNYGDLPFNSRIKSAYNAGIDAATYRAPDPDKWADNWRDKVS